MRPAGVPDHVLELAAKAGVSDFEWYSGPLELPDEHDLAVAHARREHLRELAARHRAANPSWPIRLWRRLSGIC